MHASDILVHTVQCAILIQCTAFPLSCIMHVQKVGACMHAIAKIWMPWILLHISNRLCSPQPTPTHGCKRTRCAANLVRFCPPGLPIQTASARHRSTAANRARAPIQPLEHDSPSFFGVLYRRDYLQHASCTLTELAAEEDIHIFFSYFRSAVSKTVNQPRPPSSFYRVLFSAHFITQLTLPLKSWCCHCWRRSSVGPSRRTGGFCTSCSGFRVSLRPSELQQK